MSKVIYPPCKHCGKSHGMGVEEMETGKITPMDICYDCLWSGVSFNQLEEQIELDNMEQVLKKLEDRLLISYEGSLLSLQQRI